MSVDPVERGEGGGGSWHVYILRCADDTLYTGITTDPVRRVGEHNAGARGAAYTRARRPVRLVYAIAVKDRAEASVCEYRIKRLSRRSKERLLGTAEDTCNEIAQTQIPEGPAGQVQSLSDAWQSGRPKRTIVGHFDDR